MKTHKLKCWPQFFQAVKNRSKKFEVRRNDRNFESGDRLILQEWIPETGEYTGNELCVDVTCILKAETAIWSGLQEGYCVMSVNVLSEKEVR